MLLEVNPGLNYRWIQNPEARIPLDTPACFEFVELAAGQSPHDLALELNICENVIWFYNDEQIYEASDEALSIYLPLERKACYQDGQVLITEYYPNEHESYYRPSDVVYLEEPMQLWAFAAEESYCYYELEPLNRGKSVYRSFREEICIPEVARHCQLLTDREISIVELAREYNICIEALLEVNPSTDSWTVFPADYQGIWIPINDPCYDDNGFRLGENDRTVHQTSKEEWLYAIAQQYKACMGNLYAANPLLKNYPYTDLPSLIFIPDVPACSDLDENGFIRHEMRDDEIFSLNNSAWTYRNLAYIYTFSLAQINHNHKSVLSFRISSTTPCQSS